MAQKNKADLPSGKSASLPTISSAKAGGNGQKSIIFIATPLPAPSSFCECKVRSLYTSHKVTPVQKEIKDNKRSLVPSPLSKRIRAPAKMSIAGIMWISSFDPLLSKFHLGLAKNHLMLGMNNYQRMIDTFYRHTLVPIFFGLR